MKRKHIDSKTAPSDAELVERLGVDFRGNAAACVEQLHRYKRNLGGAFYRVTIRECRTGEFWTRDELKQLAGELFG